MSNDSKNLLSFFMVQILRACAYYNSGDYTHLGFGALRRVNGLGLVKLRFHVTLRDAVTQ